MSITSSPSREDKVRVLIWPVGKQQYAAICLDLCITTTEPTKKAAVETIAGLIEDHILTGLAHGISYDRLRANARHLSNEAGYARAWNQSEDLPYFPHLSQQVNRFVREVEFRFYQGTIEE